METLQCRKIPIQGMGDLQCHSARLKIKIMPGGPFHTQWLPNVSYSVPSLPRSNIHISLLHFPYVLCGRKNYLWSKKRQNGEKETLTLFGPHISVLGNTINHYRPKNIQCRRHPVMYPIQVHCLSDLHTRIGNLTLTLCFLEQQLGLQIPRE